MKRPLILALVLALAVPSMALADEYRPDRAGHPVRILAYVLHPVGYILDRLIFHPAWLIGQWEPIATLVGMERNRHDAEIAEQPQPTRPTVVIEIGPAKPPERERPDRY